MGKFTIKPTNTGYVFNLKAATAKSSRSRVCKLRRREERHRQRSDQRSHRSVGQTVEAMLPRRTRSLRSTPTRPASSVSA